MPRTMAPKGALCVVRSRHGFCGKGKNARLDRALNRKSCRPSPCTTGAALTRLLQAGQNPRQRRSLPIAARTSGGRHSTFLCSLSLSSAEPPSIDGKYSPCPMSWPAMLFRKIGFPWRDPPDFPARSQAPKSLLAARHVQRVWHRRGR